MLTDVLEERTDSIVRVILEHKDVKHSSLPSEKYAREVEKGIRGNSRLFSSQVI
jgi:hypothetical protein